MSQNILILIPKCELGMIYQSWGESHVGNLDVSGMFWMTPSARKFHTIQIPRINYKSFVRFALFGCKRIAQMARHTRKCVIGVHILIPWMALHT
jgi:hypothetical protein